MTNLAPGVYGLIGPNTAGKTHWLRSYHAATADGAFAPAASDALYAGRTVGTQLSLAALPRTNFNHALAERLLPVDPATPVAKLSTGQRRLLTLATTLSAGTSTILLDEPFEGLDSASRALVRQEIISLLDDASLTLILSSHRAEDLAGLVEYVIQVFERRVSSPINLEKVRSEYPAITAPQAEFRDATILESSVLGGRTRVQLAGAHELPAGYQPTYPNDAELIDLLARFERTQS